MSDGNDSTNKTTTHEIEIPGLTPKEPDPENPPHPDQKNTSKLWRQWWIWAITGCATTTLIITGSIWAGSTLTRAYQDVSTAWNARTGQSSSPSPALSHEETIAFLRAHEANIISYTKKLFAEEEAHGFLRVESVEVIPESVYEGVVDNPMEKASGLIYFDFYINGNRDYQVRASSMIGPSYRGGLMETIGDPWVPGKMCDGAGYSEKFNRVMEGWRKQIYPPDPDEPDQAE